MKKTVKILAAAILAVGFGSLANAQSASISANATVISELVVTNSANLTFGTVVVGQSKSLNGYGYVEVSTGPKLGTSVLGNFRIVAQKGSNVGLTFVLPTNLSTTEGASLPISFGDSAIGKSGAIELKPFEITNFDPSTPYQIIGFLNGSLYGEMIPYVQVGIGGTVDATFATAGTYTGTITLNATYN